MAATLLVGSVHVPVILGVALALLGIFCFALWRGAISSRLPLPAVVLSLLAAYTLLQATPLPVQLVRAVAKENIEIWRQLFELLDKQIPAALPLSLDPGASRVEAIKWASYAIGFALSAGIGARGNGAAGPIIVYLSALVVAVATLGHRLAGANTVFGIYAPMGEFAHSSIGPLLNPNNLAGFLNLGIFNGLGLMLSEQPAFRRWGLSLGVALLIGMVVESGSRGGLVSLCIGIVLLVVVSGSARAYKNRNDPRFRALVGVGVTVVAGVGLAALALTPARVAHGADGGLRKLAMASWVLPLIRDYPWFGVGRGAFESAFQQYAIGADNLVYTHPENFVVQWAAEWGIPAALALLAGLIRVLRPRALGVTKTPVALGAFLAVLVLLLQNLVDLGTEVPAIALAAVVTVGSCWGRAARARSASPSRLSRLRRHGAFVLLGGTALTLASLLPWPVEPVGIVRARLDQRFEELDATDVPKVDDVREELESAMLAHPADSYIPRLTALVAFWRHDEKALRWIGHALELGPTAGRSHLLLARMLAALGYEAQALLELRLAATYDPSLSRHVARIALGRTSDPDKLTRVAPQGNTGGQVLVAMAGQLKGPTTLALRVSLLRAAVGRAPALSVARRQLANVLLPILEGTEQSALCTEAERDRCLRQVEEAARFLEADSPTSSEGVQLRARLLVVTGRAAEASALLKESCERFEERRSCLSARLKIVAVLGDSADLQRTTDALAAQNCRSMEDCADLLSGIGDVLARADRKEMALLYFTKAAREDGGETRWMRVADLASQLGQHALAVQALTSVQTRRSRPDPKLQARMEQERAKVGLPPF